MIKKIVSKIKSLNNWQKVVLFSGAGFLLMVFIATLIRSFDG